MEWMILDLSPKTRDSLIPSHSEMNLWVDEFGRALAIHGKGITSKPNLIKELRHQNLTNWKSDSSCIPLNDWPNDTGNRNIGSWFKILLCEAIMKDTTEALFVHDLGYTQRDAGEFLNTVYEELCDRSRMEIVLCKLDLLHCWVYIYKLDIFLMLRKYPLSIVSQTLPSMPMAALCANMFEV